MRKLSYGNGSSEDGAEEDEDGGGGGGVRSDTDTGIGTASRVGGGRNGSTTSSLVSCGDASVFKSKEFSRPPVYNPEDYAASLKKWTSSGGGKSPTPTTKSNESPNVTGETASNEGEMRLRQFLSVSDLLNKLKTDLRLAYLSFVREFVSDPIDGTTLLLELLRSIQLNESQQRGKIIRATRRRSSLDENSCLECLWYCLRCEETSRRLVISSAGLYTLAVCIMSSVNKSRIISLQLLKEICGNLAITGHNAVSEAMSTMRLRFGEPVRFRFLVSVLNGASSHLLVAGLQFINVFLDTSPTKQTRLYIQAELEQAGLTTETFKKLLLQNREDESLVREFKRWSESYIDIEILRNDYESKCNEVFALKEKISQMETQIRMLRKENESLTVKENFYRTRFDDDDSGEYKRPNGPRRYHCAAAANKSKSLDESGNGGGNDRNADDDIRKQEYGGGHSTPAEDEGISSSDQDDVENDEGTGTVAVAVVATSPPLLKYASRIVRVAKATKTESEGRLAATVEADGTQQPSLLRKKPTEVTIDDVMEDFKNLIDDVQKRCYEERKENRSRRSNRRDWRWAAAGDEGADRDESSSAEALILDKDADIIPTKILPEPPKKTRTLRKLYGVNDNDRAFDRNRDRNRNRNDSSNVETNPFFEDDTNSNCSTSRSRWLPPIAFTGSSCDDSNASSSPSPSASRSPSPLPRYVRRNACTKASSNLRRSETFHQLLMDTKEATTPAAQYYGSHSRINDNSGGAMVTVNGAAAVHRNNNVKMEKMPQSRSKNRNYGQSSKYVADSDRKQFSQPLRSGSCESEGWIWSGMGGGDIRNAAKTTKMFPRLNPVSYFSITNTRADGGGRRADGGAILKRTNNAGLYSGKNHIQSSGNDNHLNQVITITSEYPKRSLNGLKQINLNICDGNIMDLPSGLY